MIKNKLFMLLIPLLLCGTGLFAQNAAVRGIVTGSPDGKPIAGASVVVKGSVRGTTTDASGAYTVAAGTGDVLVISFLGYKPQEVPVAGRTAVDVELQEDAELVEEVIVIGYGTMKKSDLTGSVASVKASDVTQVSAGSIDKLLQGRVAGLTVIDNSNDSPEGSVTMRVRGISSINGSNSPLVVVDGVPMGDAGNLTSVNPNIIESVEVLKDASATAIYGSRGANGVIMITTKNGQKDHRNVWFSGKVGVGVFSDRLDYWRDPVQMARLENEAYENGGAEGPYTGKIWSDGTYYPSIAEIESGAWPFRTKWADHVFRTSVTQDYSVGIEGSGEKNRYYVSLGYYDGEGMQYKDDFEKYTVDMSYDHQVARNINLKTKAGFVRGFRTYNNGTSYGRNPLWPVYNGDGSYFKSQPKDYGNPVMVNNEIKNESDNMSGYALVKADWTIIPGLIMSVSGNARAEQRRSAYFNPPLYTLAGDNYNGEGGNSESTYVNLTGDAYLTYNKTIGDHTFSAMLGGSYENSVSRGSSITGRGFSNAALKDEVVSGADKVITSTSRSQEILASGFTRLNYTFKNRYLVTFTARADGASKFAKGHRWGFFPSGAVSWKLEEEPWIKSLGFFDQLKLRASYGVSGNQGISPYQTFERFGFDYYWSGGKEYTVYGIGYQDGREGLGNRFVTYAGMANHELTWEKTAQMDIGLDLSIFRGRLNVTLDYYIKKTTDLLRKQYLPPSTGFDTVWVNDGEIRNKGFEVAVTGRIVSTKDWNFSATGIFSLNRNKVVSIGTAENSGATVDANGICYTQYGGSVYNDAFLNVLAIGYPVNSFYGYMVNGIIQTPQGDGSSPNTRPGELNYVGLNADGTLDPNERVIIGNPNPKFTSSLSLSLSHRCGLDLSVMMYAVYGNDIFSYRKLESPALKAGRWTAENPNNERPSLRYNRQYHASSWSVEDGSFLRISNITLGYTLPAGKLNWIRNLRVYVSASNPFTFSKVSEYDPEVGENGIGSVAYPKVCVITAGAEFKF